MIKKLVSYKNIANFLEQPIWNVYDRLDSIIYLMYFILCSDYSESCVVTTSPDCTTMLESMNWPDVTSVNFSLLDPKQLMVTDCWDKFTRPVETKRRLS